MHKQFIAVLLRSSALPLEVVAQVSAGKEAQNTQRSAEVEADAEKTDRASRSTAGQKPEGQ